MLFIVLAPAVAYSLVTKKSSCTISWLVSSSLCARKLRVSFHLSMCSFIFHNVNGIASPRRRQVSYVRHLFAFEHDLWKRDSGQFSIVLCYLSQRVSNVEWININAVITLYFYVLWSRWYEWCVTATRCVCKALAASLDRNVKESPSVNVRNLRIGDLVTRCCGLSPSSWIEKLPWLRKWGTSVCSAIARRYEEYTRYVIKVIRYSRLERGSNWKLFFVASVWLTYVAKLFARDKCKTTEVRVVHFIGFFVRYFSTCSPSPAVDNVDKRFEKNVICKLPSIMPVDSRIFRIRRPFSFLGHSGLLVIVPGNWPLSAHVFNFLIAILKLEGGQFWHLAIIDCVIGFRKEKRSSWSKRLGLLKFLWRHCPATLSFLLPKSEHMLWTSLHVSEWLCGNVTPISFPLSPPLYKECLLRLWKDSEMLLSWPKQRVFNRKFRRFVGYSTVVEVWFQDPTHRVPPEGVKF